MTDDRLLLFERHDPEARAYRWYQLELIEEAENLFGGPEVVIRRGRAGQRGETIRRSFDSVDDAHAYIDHKRRQRLSHGYQEVNELAPLESADCLLCRLVADTDNDPCFVWGFTNSVLLVGWDQTYSGRSLLVFRKHIPDFFRLAPSELLASLSEIHKAELAIRKAFEPEMMNYLFMGNVTGHVHLHLVPRYRDDPHFGQSPFLDSARVREPQLEADEYRNIAARMRNALESELQSDHQPTTGRGSPSRG